MKINWLVEKRKVSDLKLLENNPRTISKSDFEDLKRGIANRGFHDVVKVDHDGVLLSGNQRKRALEELGILEVWVLYPDRKMTEKERKEIIIESNLHRGDFDFDVLANEYPLEMLKDLGFDESGLDKLLDDIKEDEFDAEAEYQKIIVPKSKKGDIFELGKHRLMCGSSESQEDFQKLMGGVQAQLIFTDPPYSVDYHSSKGNSYSKGKYNKGKKGDKIFNDDKSNNEALSFYKNVLLVLDKVSKNNVVIYWWFANQKNWLNRLAWIETGWRQSQIIVWVKNSMIFSPGQMYHRQYEPCMVGWKEKGTHYHNKRIANLKDVFNLDFDNWQEAQEVWFEKRDNTSQYVHPTQKPVRLAERALKKNSKIDDVVIDAFGGSGSTLLACEQLNRRCYMMELDPKYCDVIIKRWELFTNKKAKKL